VPALNATFCTTLDPAHHPALGAAVDPANNAAHDPADVATVEPYWPAVSATDRAAYDTAYHAAEFSAD
jgi:hypothetical protein